MAIIIVIISVFVIIILIIILKLPSLLSLYRYYCCSLLNLCAVPCGLLISLSSSFLG